MYYSTIPRKKSKIKTSTFVSVQENMLVFAIFLLMFCILTKPTAYSKSVISGLKLFFSAVLPGLLPFMFLCKILTNLNIQKHLAFMSKPMQKIFGLSKECAYPFFISIISGYPIGSKITSDLYESYKISDKDLLKCAVLSSTSGLIFIIGSVGSAMIGNVKVGILIYFASILSCILSVIILNLIDKIKNIKTKPLINATILTAEAGFTNNTINISSNNLTSSTSSNQSNIAIQKSINNNTKSKDSILNIMTTSAADTCQSLLIVCFYISFFFVLIDILSQTKILGIFSKAICIIFSSNPDKMALSQGIVSGIVEMTRGVKMLSFIKTPLSFSLICSLISFGGFSIIFQSLAFLSKTNIKFSKFIFAKLLQALLAFLICFAMLLIFNI